MELEPDVGVAVRMRDALTLDGVGVGVVSVPPPVEPGDMLALEGPPLRIASVLSCVSGSTIVAAVTARATSFVISGRVTAR